MFIRKDGRGKNVLRPIKITKNFIRHTPSCLIEIGYTKVICTAVFEETVPPFLKNTNTGWITAEYGMIPGSCSVRVQRESMRGKVDGRTYEIQRLIGRAIRAVVDTKSIGENTIRLDCDVIQADGGTRTASITGAFIACVLCLENLRKNRVLNFLPVKNFVAGVSVGIVSSISLLDLCYEEDMKAEVDMNIVMTDTENFVEIQGTAEQTPFSKELMDELLKLAKKGIMELIEQQKKALEIEVFWEK